MKKIYIAGHNGMVGSAISRAFAGQADVEIITNSRNELDLTNQRQVHEFFADTAIAQVYLAAAKVGGIHANNTYPAEFIYDNLMIECNLINAAYSSGVRKLLFLGSSCIYPKTVEQPMCESALLTGTLESTNEPYAIAKIAGIKLCESYNRQYGVDYRSVMPTNLYGPNDNFHSENSHVIPALMRRFHEARLNQEPKVTVWGSGDAKREFLHVDDMAAASIFVMNTELELYASLTRPMLSHINVGTGLDCSIGELAKQIASVVGYGGDIVFDKSRPDGTPRKLMDVSVLESMGWKYSVELKSGLESTYQWFLAHQDRFRGKAA